MDRPETYALPVKIASGDAARAVFQSTPGAIIARFASTEETILMDAIWDGKFRSQLFEAIAQGQIIKGQGGDLVGIARKTLQPRRYRYLRQIARVGRGAEQLFDALR